MSSKYSYSKIDTYSGCPFKFKLQYLDGNYAYTGSIATEFGSALHAAEEAIAKAIQANEPIDYAKIKNDFLLSSIKLELKYPSDYIANDGKSGRNYKDKTYEYLQIGVYRLEKYMNEHPTYKIVGIEQKFNIIFDEEHTFNGAIDRVFYDEANNSYIIHDIKTYAVPIDSKDLATPLQFVFYTLAVKDLYSCNESQIRCQYDLPLVGVTQDGGTTGYMTRGINKIKQLFSGIESNNFEPHPSPLCNWCAFCKTNPDGQSEFNMLCPYYSLWERDTRNKYDINKHENEWTGLDDYPKILLEHKQKHTAN